MLITSLTTRSGQTIDLNKVTVLVGPNNCGKSLTLLELAREFQNQKHFAPQSLQQAIVAGIELRLPAHYGELMEGLRVVKTDETAQDTVFLVDDQGMVDGSVMDLRSFQQLNDADPTSQLFRHLARAKITRRIRSLGAERRLSMANTTQSNGGHSEGLLHDFYSSRGVYDDEFKQAFREAFGLDILLDHSSRESLMLRIADDLSDVPENQRLVTTEFKNKETLDRQGDGMRSFVGVILSILLAKDHLILLDEPEAFLHPAQARLLGNLVAKFSKEMKGQLIIATHSSSFLAGILSAQQEVDIYRLNRSESTTVFSRMAAEDSQKLTTVPLLASQRVVDAIFQEGVVVCESDRDRLVYQAVATQVFGDQGIFFLQADNKQTLGPVVELMRKLNIPVTAIADIDVLDDAKTFGGLLNSFEERPEAAQAMAARDLLATTLQGRPDNEIFDELQAGLVALGTQLSAGEHTLEGARSALKRLMTHSSSNRWRALKENGLDAASASSRPYADQAINSAQVCGLFIVPVGELENWIHLDYRKALWPVPALTEIYGGHTPEPLQQFVQRVLEHLRDRPVPVKTKTSEEVTVSTLDDSAQQTSMEEPE